MSRLCGWMVIAVTGLLASAGALQAGEGGPWLTDIEAAKRQAAEQKRPILADFSGSDWCGWCIRLEKEVFSQKAFQNYAATNLVLFLADFPARKPQPEAEAAQNKKLAAAYAIEGYPTVLLLDDKGKELARTGYQSGGAEAYVEHLKTLLKDPAKK